MLFWALAACDLVGAPDIVHPGRPDTGVPDDDTGSVDETLPDAESIILEARAGGDAMLSLSQRYGFPVETQDGWVFLCEAQSANIGLGYLDWSEYPMDCTDGVCSYIDADAVGGYKFVIKDTWASDPWSRAYQYDENGEMSLIAPDGAHLERHFGIKSTVLEARTARVWVPKGEISHTLYAHDGQNLFDPEAIWGGWHLQDAVPTGMMIVGLDNTAARMEEYTHVPDHIDGEKYGGEGDEYADLIEDELRPLIASEYGEAPKVGLLGSSLGGLISLHVAQRYEGEYDFAASMSGTLGWGSIEDHNETIIERYAAAGHGSTAIYLDSGGSGTTCADSDGDGINDDDLTASDNYCETLQMRDTLEAAGYTFETDLWHWHEEGAEHNEMYWADRVWRPLEIFAGL